MQKNVEVLENTKYLEPLRSSCEEQFRSLYGYEPQRSFFSPGRINIIGDHIDYNGGLVFPCAIELGTFASVGLRRDRKLRLYSHNFPEQAPREFREFSAIELEYRKEYDWCNYVLGMVDVLNKELGSELALPDSHALGLDLWEGQGIGLDIVFYGNLPSGGSGLSSSASIEVLMGYILLSYSRTNLARERLAVLAQRAENEFCGMHCGIMDQFVIAVAEQGHACLLDCATLNYEQVPLNFTSLDALTGTRGKKASHAFLIANTKLPRKLQDSKYNQRRAECEEALATIRARAGQSQEQDQNLGVKENLCAIREDELPAALALLEGHDVLLRRTRHVVSEHGRTLAAAAAMKANNWAELARLMTASHASLRDDYDVSGQHLDTLVTLLHEVDGVLGARMTGAGFSGCAVALLDLEVFEKNGTQQLENLAENYKQKFSWRPEFYRSEVVAGVRELA